MTCNLSLADVEVGKGATNEPDYIRPPQVWPSGQRLHRVLPPACGGRIWTGAIMLTLANAALEYEAAGLHVVYLRPREKIPTEHGWQRHRPDASDIAQQWRSLPNGNVGMATGAASGVVIVDPDSPEALEWCRQNLPPTPWRVITAKGEHWGYRSTEPTGNRTAAGCRVPTTLRREAGTDHSACHAGGALCRLDIRGDGGQVVMPPSIHPTGVVYTWAGAPFPDPVDLPEWDASWLPVPAVVAVTAPVNRTEMPRSDMATRAAAWLERRDPACFGTGSGDSHYWATVVKVVRDFGLGDGPDAFQLLSGFDRSCQPPQGDAFLRAKIATAMRSGQNAIGSIADRPLDVAQRIDADQWSDRRRSSRAADVPAGDGFIDATRARISDDPVIVWPYTTDKGAPLKSHSENMQAMLDAYGIKVRHNLMTHRLEVSGTPGPIGASERRENLGLERIHALADRHRLGKQNVMTYLTILATEYHPVADWIDSVPWDGIDRLQQFMNTIQLHASADPHTASIVIMAWMRTAVAAVLPDYDGQVEAQGVLVIQGAQGIGKTRWIRSLAPGGTQWIRSGATLDPHNKDSVLAIIRYWVAELGELDGTFRKSDVAALKAFVTAESDTIRAPYARTDERVSRRTVMTATVNAPDYLVDDTGNRRWWTVAVERMTPLDADFPLQQLWAQIAADVRAGGRWWLTSDEQELLEMGNQRHMVADTLTQELWETWRPSIAPVTSQPRVSLNQVCRGMAAFATRAPTSMESRRVAAALRKAGCEHDTRSNGMPMYGVEQIASPMPGIGSSRSWY